MSIRRVSPGQPIPLNAQSWNAMHGAVDQASVTRTFGGSDLGGIGPSHTYVLCKHYAEGTSDLESWPRYSVVGIQRSLNNSTTNPNLFLERPVLIGERATLLSHFGKLAITYDSIPRGEIGRVHVCGVTLARLHQKVGEAACEFADLYDRDSGGVWESDLSQIYLQTHWSGSWRILYRDVTESWATDEHIGWAIVQHVGLQQRTVKVKLDADLAAGGTAAASVYIGTTDTDSNITLSYNWMDGGGEQISAGKEALAKWFPDELKWVVVAAECE